MKISKRFLTRAKLGLRRYQRILASARARDVNESDTVVIVADFLEDVLGYDKYSEVTTEHAIRGTYCDLAVTPDGHVRFLIEVKAIGQDLRDTHLRQAIDYGANAGVEWVLLTNGVEWQAHRIQFEKPIEHELVFRVDLLNEDVKPAALLETLYLISRETSSGGAIDEYRRHREFTNRFVLGQLIVSETVVKVIRRELRRLGPEIRVSEEEITERLRSDVIKRDVLEGEKAKAATRVVRRAARRRAQKSSEQLTDAKVGADPA